MLVRSAEECAVQKKKWLRLFENNARDDEEKFLQTGMKTSCILSTKKLKES
jgi:hypothetical protein